MGKTRDLVKKIGDTKGTFHAKMGLIKDRNGMGPCVSCTDRWFLYYWHHLGIGKHRLVIMNAVNLATSRRLRYSK